MTVSEKKASILDIGDGLFQTHVQLEDVQKVIGEQMNTKARLGENTKYTVIGDGNGFSSRVILVEPEWTVSDKHLPEKFVLKITSCLHVPGLIEQMKGKNPGTFPAQEAALWAIFENEAQKLHNREVNLYKITEKWNKNETMLSPKIYFYKKFDAENKTKGILGMEFDGNVTVRHIYCNVKPRELYPVLRSIATLQAGSLHLTKDEIESISGLDVKQMMGSLMNNEGMKGFYEQTREINRKRLTEKTNVVEAFGQEVVNFELACNLNKYIGIKRDVMVHGDLWAANILWKEKDEGTFSVSKVIDYQLIHMGNPAEDLVRLFLSTLSGADRQAHWERLLEKFYTYFLAALGDDEAPYSLEQLKECYRCFFVSGGLVMMPMYGPFAQAKLSYLKDIESVQEYQEILTEKAEHLMEDLERWHLYSRDKTNNFKEAEISK